MTNSNFSLSLDAAISQFNLLEHPFYQAWSAGTLSIETLREYAKQYYHFEKNFPRFLSNVHANCEDVTIRQHLLDNLWDEEHGENNHRQMWLNFAEGLGLTQEEVTTSIATEETDNLIATMIDLTRNHSTAEGIGALYGYESQVPNIATAKIKGLVDNYGIADDRSLSFFRVHETLDLGHRDVELRLLQSLVVSNESKESVITAAAQSASAMYDMLSGVLRVASIAPVTA